MKKRFVLICKLIKSLKHIQIVSFFYFLLIISCFYKLEAQQVSSFSNIQYLTSNEGLSQNEVTAILQDKKGFIWIGTRGGLNRYDGSTIKIFQNEIGNTNSLINNSIEALFEDSHGYIWIGTKSNGLSRYNPEYDIFEQITLNYSGQLSSLNERVVSIAESINGEIWVGTWNSGLIIYNTETKLSRQIRNKNKANIYKTKDNTMWATTADGAYNFTQNGEEIEHIESPGFTSMVVDENTGHIFFGSWGRGLIEYNPKTKTKIYYRTQDSDNHTITSNNAYKIYKDKQQSLWVGTWGGGLNRFDLKTKTFSKYDLTINRKSGGVELYQDVISIFQDKSGILWFGTNGGGIAKVDSKSNRFAFLSNKGTSPKLPKEPVWSFFKDNRERFFVSYKGDKNVYYSENDQPFMLLPIPNSFKGSSVTRKPGVKTMYQDKYANMWMADNSSIYLLDEKRKKLERVIFKNNDTSQAVNLRKVTAMFQSSDSIFWIGTQQLGLRKSLGKGNPINQTYETLLDGNRISTFVEDRLNNLWIGTYGGLVKYSPHSNKYNKYTKNPGSIGALSSNIVLSMLEDKRGNLWIGTPNGLNLSIPQSNGELKFKTYQVNDGLPSNYIHAILEDEKNNLWISTHKGISRFNTNDNSFYNYDVNDGLESNSFMENVAFKDASGKLYYGGDHGINCFYPDSISTTSAPKVYISDFKINGQSISPNQEFNNRKILNRTIEFSESLSLKSTESIFTIEYTALDFYSSSRYAYTFMMKGLDEEWQGTTSQKSITYSNLDPGNYEFLVKTALDSNDIETVATSLKIEVLPPYWKTWQAFLLYLLIFIGLLYLFSYYTKQRHALETKLDLAKLNRKKEKELAEMKTRFFTNIAHEIRTPLSLITGPVESLIDNNLNNEQKKNHLTTVQYHTNRLLNLVSQLLDFRKVESGKMTLQVATGNFSKFTNEIFLSFRELAKSKQIQFELESSTNELELTYDRKKMEIVLCNLLSNAFKYCKSEIKINLSTTGINKSDINFNPKFPNGYCYISIIDNGQGMPKEVVNKIFDRFYQIANTESINLIGTGIGLALVKNIVELHKGTISVESTKGKGSAFTVKIPLGKTHFNKEQFIADFKKAEDPIHYQVERNLPITQNNLDNSTTLPSLLIVEDNPEIRLFISSVFQTTFNIHEAENGKIGLQKAKKIIPDVIISDLMMPEMDGLEFCNTLKATKETLHIPVIMLTARTTSVFQEKGYSSGVDIYVTKPFNPNVLKAQVEGLLNSRQRLRDYFSKNITLLPTENNTPSLEQEFLNKLIELVENNLTNENLNREYLASRMSVSPSTLYRKIKSITDLDVTAFISSIRLKRAAQMIINKEDTISGIAYQVGFSDPKYFRKCFIKQFGITPSKYTKV